MVCGRLELDFNPLGGQQSGETARPTKIVALCDWGGGSVLEAGCWPRGESIHRKL